MCRETTKGIERIDLLMEELNLAIPALVAGDGVEEDYGVEGTPYSYTGRRKGNEVTIKIKINE